MHHKITDLPSLDFIAGLVTSSGSFMIVCQNKKSLPMFQLKTHTRDTALLKAIKEKLCLQEKIYSYAHQGRRYSILLIRRTEVLENVIIPSFDNRLLGHKASQFEAWKKHFYKRKYKKELSNAS